MAIKSGFFNSVNGDRKYNAEDMSHYFEGLITDGIYESIGDKLQVTAGGGMTINIGTGRAMIDCHWMKNDAIVNVAIDAADVQLNRWDCVVVKLDLNDSARKMSIEIIKGTPGNPASLPVFNDTQTVKYLWIASVYVAAGVTSITQGRIYDMRGKARCPYVTGLIKQVDTSQLFAQWQDACEQYYNDMTAEMNAYFAEKQSEFESWFSTLTGTLTVDTYIQKYQNTYNVETETAELTIGISEYDSSKDILFVNINGVQFVEDLEYTISGTGAAAKITLKNTIKPDNQITFIVLKSKIGSST